MSGRKKELDVELEFLDDMSLLAIQGMKIVFWSEGSDTLSFFRIIVTAHQCIHRKNIIPVYLFVFQIKKWTLCGFLFVYNILMCETMLDIPKKLWSIIFDWKLDFYFLKIVHYYIVFSI